MEERLTDRQMDDGWMDRCIGREKTCTTSALCLHLHLYRLFKVIRILSRFLREQRGFRVWFGFRKSDRSLNEIFISFGCQWGKRRVNSQERIFKYLDVLPHIDRIQQILWKKTKMFLIFIFTTKKKLWTESDPYLPTPLTKAPQASELRSLAHLQNTAH